MKQALAYCVVILIAVAAATGYHLGKQNVQPEKDYPALIAQQQSDIEDLKSKLTSLQERLDTRQYATPPAPAPGSSEVNPYALRAEQETQVFTDRQGRELVASILEVQADTARIRRKSDGREFILTQSNLVAEDRAFLQYLYAQNKKTTPETKKPNVNDVDWDSIFGK